jgi:hypothetical protein
MVFSSRSTFDCCSRRVHLNAISLILLGLYPFILYILFHLILGDPYMSCVARLADDKLFYMYLCIVIFSQMNSLLTYTLFIYMGRLLGWFSFRHRLKNVWFSIREVSESSDYSLRDSTELSPFIHRDYGFFSIWGQDWYWFNGPFCSMHGLWVIIKNWQMWYGFVSNTLSGIMFFQSAGSIVAFLHLMNSILGDSNNEMCLTRDTTSYCTAL